MSQNVQEDASATQHGNLFVVESVCTFSAGRERAVVVIESKNPVFPRAIEELKDASARRLAQAYAATQGVSSPCINGNDIGPYAINEDGVPLDLVMDAAGKKYPPQHPKMQPAKYRIEVPICRKMV